MKKLLLSSLFFCLLHCLGLQLNAQSRQPDSLKNKQVQFNKMKQEAEYKKKQEELAKKNAKPGPVVVTYDSKGNKVEAFKSNDGGKTSVTVITLPPVLNRKFNADTVNRDSISIKVIKSKYRLQIHYKGKILTAYKCVFGPNCMEQKRCEGDRNTPEGTFTILTCKQHDKWDLFMLLDYPNDESKFLFEQNKAKGLIPQNATIGGLVGIHGIWLNGDNVIDLKHNWTDGCISLKNKDVEELAKIVKPGTTKITIVR